MVKRVGRQPLPPSQGRQGSQKRLLQDLVVVLLHTPPCLLLLITLLVFPHSLLLLLPPLGMCLGPGLSPPHFSSGLMIG